MLRPEIVTPLLRLNGIVMGAMSEVKSSWLGIECDLSVNSERSLSGGEGDTRMDDQSTRILCGHDFTE